MLKLNGTLRRPIFLWLSSFVADALEGRRSVAEADAAIRSVRTSAEAAARALADYFHQGFVTGHKPRKSSERQLSDFLCGSTRP